MEKEKYLTCQDVAKILEVSSQTILNWVTDGRLKSYKLNTRRRIKPKWLIDYLEKLGNPPEAMRRFKAKIEDFLDSKYDVIHFKPTDFSQPKAEQMDANVIKSVEQDIKFLIAGMKNTPTNEKNEVIIPNKYTAELRLKMDFLQATRKRYMRLTPVSTGQ